MSVDSLWHFCSLQDGTMKLTTRSQRNQHGGRTKGVDFSILTIANQKNSVKVATTRVTGKARPLENVTVTRSQVHAK
jgi:hypothetical protein